MSIMRLLFIGVVLTSALGFVGYHILSFFFSIQVSRSKLKADLEEMKQRLFDKKAELIPLDSEILNTLSFYEEDHFLNDKISTSKEGIFTSIFHEPLLAYSYKKYKGRDDRAILLLETNCDTYEYVISDGVTKITKNDESFAIVHNDGKMYDNSGELLAAIEIKDSLLLPITIGSDQPKALLTNPFKTKNTLSRAYELLDSDTLQEQESILLLSTLIAIQAEE